MFDLKKLDDMTDELWTLRKIVFDLSWKETLIDPHGHEDIYVKCKLCDGPLWDYDFGNYEEVLHAQTNYPHTEKCPFRRAHEFFERCPIVQQQNEDGTWSLSEPLPVQGFIARTELWLRKRGFDRAAKLLAWIDERGLGR